MGSIVNLGYLPNGQDGRLYPSGVHKFLALVLTPCPLHGDSYRRQEARVGCYDAMHSRGTLRAFVPLNPNTTRVNSAHSC